MRKRCQFLGISPRVNTQCSSSNASYAAPELALEDALGIRANAVENDVVISGKVASDNESTRRQIGRIHRHACRVREKIDLKSKHKKLRFISEPEFRITSRLFHSPASFREAANLHLRLLPTTTIAATSRSPERFAEILIRFARDATARRSARDESDFQ
jgi:hypothetical protein